MTSAGVTAWWSMRCWIPAEPWPPPAGTSTALGPRSLAACVLLAKAGAREVEVTAEYVGFTVADRFLVGYGLDHAQRYRNLPYVATLRE